MLIHFSQYFVSKSSTLLLQRNEDGVCRFTDLSYWVTMVTTALQHDILVHKVLQLIQFNSVHISTISTIYVSEGNTDFLDEFYYQTTSVWLLFLLGIICQTYATITGLCFFVSELKYVNSCWRTIFRNGFKKGDVPTIWRLPVYFWWVCQKNETIADRENCIM